MNRIAISGIGPVGGFGAGRQQLLNAIENPQGPNKTVTVSMPQGEVTTPVYLAETDRLEEFIAKKQLRRVDHFSRVVTLAMALALDDAGRIGKAHDRLGVVLALGYGANATTFRFLESCLDYGDEDASPLMFGASGHFGPVANASILLGITGPVLTVCQPETGVITALLTAAQWLEEGRADAVLVGGADEYCSALGYVHRVRFGPADGGPLNPFDLARHSAVCGEGAAFLLLERDTECRRPVLGDLLIRAHAPPAIQEEAVVLLGADGYRCHAPVYEKLVSSKKYPCVNYAPLFGSMPSSAAFHAAIAAAFLKSGTFAALPNGVDNFTRRAASIPTSYLCLEATKDGLWNSACIMSGRQNL